MTQLLNKLSHDTLTIGVIAKNGLPFLAECLAALPTNKAWGKTIELILVDCCSTDKTKSVMKEYAEKHRNRNVRVFEIKGTANAAVARNIVLNHSSGQYLMLLDGDTVLSHDFIANGIKTIETGLTDAVNGMLLEQRHNSEHQPYGEKFFRFSIEESEYVRTSGGNIFLGPRVINSGIRFDETLRRSEDRDFALRLSEKMKLLQIPVSMGVHLTHHYYSPKRIKEFYHQRYQRPIGLLLRKHGLHLDRLWLILQLEVGIVTGFFYYFLFLISLIMKSTLFFGAFLLFMLADYCRFLFQHRPHEFIPIRLISPIMVMQGLLGIGETKPHYTIKEV